MIFMSFVISIFPSLFYFLLAVVMLFAGYLWRMSHEVESKNLIFDAGRQTVVQEIEREVAK